jgi:hypothetical protein
MRITKVALAFFSIGFLAGSFERAAGLGHSELSTAAQERRVGAAVTRGTMLVKASFTSFGGLPDELLARSSLPQADLPEAVFAGLAESAAEADLAIQLRQVRYAPEVPAELALLAPLAMSDLTRRRLIATRAMSEPQLLPLSMLPPPMSLPPNAPSDVSPSAGSERDTQTAGGPEFIMPFERGRVTSLFHQGRYHPPSGDRSGRLAGFTRSRHNATAEGDIRGLAQRLRQHRRDT